MPVRAAKLSSTARIGRLIEAAFITERIPGAARAGESCASAASERKPDAVTVTASETTANAAARARSPRSLSTGAPPSP